MHRLWATQIFLIGILLCSLASANSISELVQQRDALDHKIKFYEQLLHSGLIFVPSLIGPPKYYSAKEFGQILPQSMIEHGYSNEDIVGYLTGIITYHQGMVQDIRTNVIPRLQRDIQELNSQISAMSPVPQGGQPGNSENQIDLNIYSSNYGNMERALNTPADQNSISQESMTPQRGIVAKITQKYPCKYRSGGDPDNKSNDFCKIEFSLENTTDKTINFNSGFTETEHEWNGGFKRENIGYKYSLKPGQTILLGGQCIIPHGASYGNWRAWGSGFHYGNQDKEQFKWNLESNCP